jgi:hypothetical protein
MEHNVHLGRLLDLVLAGRKWELGPDHPYESDYSERWKVNPFEGP